MASDEIIQSIAAACLERNGEACVPKVAKQALSAVAQVLNILDRGRSGAPAAHHLSTQHAMPARRTVRERPALSRE